MEHPDSKDTADENVAGATTPRPSAIERQIAATSGLGYDSQTYREADHIARRKFRRFGLASFLVLFLLVVAGMALLFTDIGRSLQKAVSEVVRNDSLLATHPSPTTNPSPANASQTVAPKKVAEVSTPNALSIPIADVSLRNRPELLEQLVQVYRSQLADDPSNSVALTALNQLQERSLSELQAIVLEGDDATAVKSLVIISQLFPEAADSARYKYLVARTDRIHRQAKDEPAAKPEPSPPLPTTNSPATNSSATIPPTKSVSSKIDSSAAVVKKTAENAPSSKPEIRAVSITPGTMVENRFVPSADGNVFMVEISYRNFGKISEDPSEVSLVALLGVPGDPTVLAEAPVEILGDRGTKSFVMTTLMPGNTGGKYQLNFILNGEFLASRTLRLSMPGQ